MLEGLAAGESDAQALAELAEPKPRAGPEELRGAAGMTPCIGGSCVCSWTGWS
jgi:hypothetical protein